MIRKINYVSFILLMISGTLVHARSHMGHEEHMFVFNQLLAISDEPISPNEAANFNYKFATTIELFEEKQRKWNDDERLLSYVFYKTHHMYLKRYQPLGSFGKMLKTGEYGCLSGTSLYALIISELGYDYSIIENNYHVYLLIKVGSCRYLMESTDPLQGFYKNQRVVDTKLASASRNEIGKNKGTHAFQFQLNGAIDLKGLVGLQHYNMAVVYYNNGELLAAMSQLNKSVTYYQSERIKEFLFLILDEFDQDVQALILEKKGYKNLGLLVSR